jgi:hypothetical protein
MPKSLFIFAFQKRFCKKLIFLLQIKFFFVFSDRFNLLMSKIIFKK